MVLLLNVIWIKGWNLIFWYKFLFIFRERASRDANGLFVGLSFDSVAEVGYLCHDHFFSTSLLSSSPSSSSWPSSSSSPLGFLLHVQGRQQLVDHQEAQQGRSRGSGSGLPRWQTCSYLKWKRWQQWKSVVIFKMHVWIIVRSQSTGSSTATSSKLFTVWRTGATLHKPQIRLSD